MSSFYPSGQVLFLEKWILCPKLINYARNSLIMHDPDTNSFSWQPLIITKVRARFGSQRTGTFPEKVDFTNRQTDRRREIRYRLAAGPVKNGPSQGAGHRCCSLTLNQAYDRALVELKSAHQAHLLSPSKPFHPNIKPVLSMCHALY